MNQISRVFPFTPAQSVSLVAGTFAGYSKGIGALPPSGILKIYPTDYSVYQKSMDCFLARQRKLQRAGLPKNSVRLEIVMALGDPRAPWEVGQIRRFVSQWLQTCPEVMSMLDVASIAIVERCHRVPSSGGPTPHHSALCSTWISDVQSNVWRRLCHQQGMDPVATLDVLVKAAKPGTYYI